MYDKFFNMFPIKNTFNTFGKLYIKLFLSYIKKSVSLFLCRSADYCVCVCMCLSPYFQTAQFQSNILIHLISYMLHVVTLDL